MNYALLYRNIMILLLVFLIALRHLSWSVPSYFHFSSLGICLMCYLIVVFLISVLWLLYLGIVLGICVQDNSFGLWLLVLDLLYLLSLLYINNTFPNNQQFLSSFSLTIIKYQELLYSINQLSMSLVLILQHNEAILQEVMINLALIHIEL